MRHFLFEDKEYKIHPYWKRPRKERDSVGTLLRALRHRKGGGSGSGGGIVRDARQKCVVKMQYSSSRKAHKVQLEEYLVRDGTERDGGQAALYGDNTAEYEAAMTAKNFRVFLSPQSDKVDLRALTKKFVKQIELETGYKLWWQAANHYNTAHPHAHLLINGVDKNGKEVVFPRDVVKTFMREAARDLCTAQLGKRTQEEISLEKEREITASRWTRLDESVKALCGGTWRPDLSAAKAEKPRIVARLETLRELKLCAWTESGYKLSPRWEEDLRANGRYNTFLQARSELQTTHPSKLSLYNGEAGQIEGRVTKVYRLDGDASDNHAVLLETKDGRAFFVPLFKAPEAWEGKGEKKTAVVAGDTITLSAHKSQSGRLTPVMRKRAARGILRGYAT